MKLPAERILVRVPNPVGDLIMATPALRCLRENYPDAAIDVLLRPNVAGLLDDAPWVDEFIELRGLSETFGTFCFARMTWKLRRRRYDLALVLPNSFRSALLVAASGAGERVGYARDGRSWLLTRAIERPAENGRFKPTYMGDYYLRLCEAVGCRVGDRRPELFTSSETDALARERLSNLGADWSKRLVLLCPGAAFGPSKLWPEERWAALAERLSDELDVNLVLTGGPADAPLAQRIAAQARRPLINLAGAEGGLKLMKSVAKLADLMVTVDSGSRHFAVAFQKPVVVLMGPTHPGYTATPFERGEVIRLDVDCGPCQKKKCPADHRCMRGIAAEQVFAACVRALAPTRGQ